MENKLGKQLTIYIVLLAVVWVLVLSFQIRLAKKAYSNQKDLYVARLNRTLEDILVSTDTVDFATLNVMIANSLERNDMGYPFDLGIYSDEEGRFVLLTENADTAAMLSSGYREKLFRLTDGEVTIETVILHFPTLVRKLHREMIIGYAAIFLMLILLLCCFINFFYIILKQRKIFLFREKMAHFITHEVKTPLTTINLSAQLLKDDSVVTDEAAKNNYLDMIVDETKVLESLVDEVLTVFRLERMPMADVTDIEIHKLLKEVCKVHTAKLNDCEAKVKFDLKADREVVEGNYTHLFNAFSNLVDNAVKYRKESLRLNIATRNCANDIQIIVADNGIGISEENLPLIFEPFTRLNTDDVHYVKGFGMGLDYVKHIVEFHKGTITVESELGKGTVFTITLPLKNK